MKNGEEVIRVNDNNDTFLKLFRFMSFSSVHVIFLNINISIS